MNSLELKIPPVAVVLCTASAMWAVARFVPVGGAQLPLPHFFSDHMCRHRRGHERPGGNGIQAGTHNGQSHHTRSNIPPVHSGIYSLTRNPMYLGFLLILCGWAIFLRNAFVFPLLPMFILYMNRFQIQPEERALTENFGTMFTGYTARVRRWI